MYIQLQKYSGNRYIPIRTVRDAKIPNDSGLYISLNQIDNASTLLPSGRTMWDLIPLYQQFDQACIVKLNESLYSIEFNVELIKNKKKGRLEYQTKKYITNDSPDEKRMPEWRQARWNDYAIMYEKKKIKNDKLNDREAIAYNSMIDASKSETEDSVYQNVLNALQWIFLCLQQHDIMEKQILALTDIETALKFDTSQCPYPAWVGV